ncbi:hypothetical protein KAU04_05200 [bacterium]|nr:hypothetical protein [bacterium]MCK4597411.1 hypothetical protein [bacterium]
MKAIEQIAHLPKEELLKLIEVYAKNWLAHDGCWFLATEEKYGMQAAIELDARSWERFAATEARRIMKTFQIPENGGLKALEKALGYRLYAPMNLQKVEWTDQGTMIFRMVTCRVQDARRRKGLPDFPCKPVGIVEFSTFAKTVDPRIETTCVGCPPDQVEGFTCGWEFKLKDQ